jgi:hypothetical protein
MAGEVVVERRRHPRINGRFVVSYLTRENGRRFDISQAKNISLGGMLFTSCEKFVENTSITLKIRLPFFSSLIISTGRVLESREVIKDLVYDTRLQFLDMDAQERQIMGEAFDDYLSNAA